MLASLLALFLAVNSPSTINCSWAGNIELAKDGSGRILDDEVTSCPLPLDSDMDNDASAVHLATPLYIITIPIPKRLYSGYILYNLGDFYAIINDVEVSVEIKLRDEI